MTDSADTDQKLSNYPCKTPFLYYCPVMQTNYLLAALLQGKGAITTYWLRGEINPEFPDLVPTNDASYCSTNSLS